MLNPYQLAFEILIFLLSNSGIILYFLNWHNFSFIYDYKKIALLCFSMQFSLFGQTLRLRDNN